MCKAGILTYLDDSGSADSPVLAIGGGISPLPRWVEFRHELKCLLSSNGLQKLHMGELGWNEQAVGPIVRKAFALVDKYIECYVGFSVREELQNLNRYHDTALACISEVIDIVHERWPNEKVEIIFERTQRRNGPVVDAVKERIKNDNVYQHVWERLFDIRTEDKNTIELGAADLIASTYRVLAETQRPDIPHLSTLKQWAVKQLQSKPCQRLYVSE